MGLGEMGGWKKLGVGEGTMFGTYCMREDSIFSKKENLIFS